MEKSDYREAILTDRGLYHYLERLEIPEEDFNKPDTLILDLGAGIRQRLAKEARQLELKSKIISVDPRLGLKKDEDLALPATERDLRIVGRETPEPGSLAATSDALSFNDKTFAHVYALFSVPYYLANPEEVEMTIHEVLRVLLPGGTFRAYPILQEQVAVIEKVLGGRNDVEFSIKKKDEDWLLILKKAVLTEPLK